MQRAMRRAVGAVAFVVALAIGMVSSTGAQTGGSTVIDLGGEIHDAVVASDEMAYVSVPSTDSVVALDLTTATQTTSYAVPGASGVALSVDESTLFVGSGSSATVHEIDLASGATSTIDLSALGITGVHDVVALDANRLAAVSNWVFNATQLVVIDLATGAVDAQLADVFDDADLTVTGSDLVVSTRNRITVLDAASPGLPEIATTQSSETDRGLGLIAAPDGSALYTHTGLRLTADRLIQTGTYLHGPSTSGDDGHRYVFSSHFRADQPGSIHRHDDSTTEHLAAAAAPCGLAAPTSALSFEQLSTGGFFIAAGREVCVTEALAFMDDPAPSTGGGPNPVFDGFISDVEVDDARGVAYVALPSEDSIAVVDTTTGDVLEHRFFSAPNRLDLAIDGGRLFIASLDTTGIAIWDLVTDTTTSVTIPELDNAVAWDIGNTVGDELVITSVRAGNHVHFDVGTGVTQVIGPGTDGPDLAVSATQAIVGHAFSPDVLRVYELDQPGFPWQQVRVGSSDHPLIAPDGTWFSSAGGQTFDSSSAIQTGIRAVGPSVVGVDGMVYVLDVGWTGTRVTVPRGTIVQFDADTHERLGTAPPPCFESVFFDASFERTTDGRFLVSRENALCLSGPLGFTPDTVPLGSGPVADLGGPISSVVVDDVRSRAYAAVPTRDQVSVIDLVTGDEIDRRFFLNPSEIALSADGSSLLVTLTGSSAVARWDLAADSVTTVSTDASVGPNVRRVLEPAPGMLAVGSGCTAVIDAVTGDGSCLSQGVFGSVGEGPMASDGSTLWIADGRTSQPRLWAADLTQPGLPLADPVGVPYTFTTELLSDGSTLVVGGARFDASTLVQTGRYDGEVSFADQDGIVFGTRWLRVGGEPPGNIYAWDIATTAPLAPIPMPCAFTEPDFYGALEATALRGLVLTMGSEICVTDRLAVTPLPPPALRTGPIIGLDNFGDAADALFDAGRNRTYVAVRATNEVLVIDGTTGDELERRFVRDPRGLALSPDGSRLFVALGQSTGVAIWDLSSDVLTELRIPELEGPTATDLVAPTNDLLVVSGGCTVVIDLITDDRTCLDRDPGDLLTDGTHLWVSGRNFRKIDIGDPGYPVVAQRDFANVQLDSGALFADSSRILANGTVYDADLLTPLASLADGISTVGSDGAPYVWVWSNDIPRLERFDPISLAPDGMTTAPCPFDRPSDWTVFTPTAVGFFLGSAREICTTPALDFRPGMLRVTTDPPVPGQIIVDGIPRDTWALTWMTIGQGLHEVCFGAVAGWTPPPCSTVDVLPGQTAELVGSYTELGALRVLTDPPVPSTIWVDGHPRNDWGMWTDLEPRGYEVCFGAVAGFETPACQTVSVTAGAVTTVTGAFTPGTPTVDPEYGMLRVTTDPAVPAQIIVDGVVRDTWALTWMKIAPGTHQICFGDLPGFQTPGCQFVALPPGETRVVTGAYDRLGSLRVDTDPPQNATITVDGVPRDNWGMWTDLPPATYEVCWTEPSAEDACVSADVVAGSLTIVSGAPTPL